LLIACYTRNIVSGGPSVIRKPGAYRSNLELTNSLRSSFLAAEQDYATDIPETNGQTNGIRYDAERSGRPALETWTSRDGPVLYVPRLDWTTAGLQEERSQYDITVKMFFLPDAPAADRAQYTKEALGLVQKELGVKSIDLLIASFPGMSFDGDCEWEADKKNATQGNLEEEVATWTALEHLHRQGIVKGLGIAEFGSQKLAKFMERIAIPPVVDQINTKDCCNVPPPLIKFAKEQGIELLVHSDCTDILPSGTLRDLLGQGFQGAGVLASPDDGGEGLRGDLMPEWVVKYTAFVKDRGVIENKGYFAGAELRDE
jgi:glutamate--cysteine ligase regulatory subunit